jgi:hypothetical protein
MSRRPFALNQPPTDFNTLYKKKNSLAAFQYARNHTAESNNMNNTAFLMKECKIKHRCGPKIKNIANYTSYDSLINISKIAALLDPNCSECADVPVNLSNGLQSELQYSDLYYKKCTKITVEDYKYKKDEKLTKETKFGREDNSEKTYYKGDKFCGCTRCLKIPRINECNEKLGILYPYAQFNNSTKNPAIQIKSIQNVNKWCEEKLDCPEYVLCKCSPFVKNCDCCKFTTTTPFSENTNVKYTDNNKKSCTYEKDNHFLNSLSCNQRHELLKLKAKKLADDKNLANNAVNVYSKFGAPSII